MEAVQVFVAIILHSITLIILIDHCIFFFREQYSIVGIVLQVGGSFTVDLCYTCTHWCISHMHQVDASQEYTCPLKSVWTSFYAGNFIYMMVTSALWIHLQTEGKRLKNTACMCALHAHKSYGYSMQNSKKKSFTVESSAGLISVSKSVQMYR